MCGGPAQKLHAGEVFFARPIFDVAKFLAVTTLSGPKAIKSAATRYTKEHVITTTSNGTADILMTAIFFRP